MPSPSEPLLACLAASGDVQLLAHVCADCSAPARPAAASERQAGAAVQAGHGGSARVTVPTRRTRIAASVHLPLSMARDVASLSMVWGPQGSTLHVVGGTPCTLCTFAVSLVQPAHTGNSRAQQAEAATERAPTTSWMSWLDGALEALVGGEEVEGEHAHVQAATTACDTACLGGCTVRLSLMFAQSIQATFSSSPVLCTASAAGLVLASASSPRRMALAPWGHPGCALGGLHPRSGPDSTSHVTALVAVGDWLVLVAADTAWVQPCGRDGPWQAHKLPAGTQTVVPCGCHGTEALACVVLRPDRRTAITCLSLASGRCRWSATLARSAYAVHARATCSHASSVRGSPWSDILVVTDAKGCCDVLSVVDGLRLLGLQAGAGAVLTGCGSLAWPVGRSTWQLAPLPLPAQEGSGIACEMRGGSSALTVACAPCASDVAFTPRALWTRGQAGSRVPFPPDLCQAGEQGVAQVVVLKHGTLHVCVVVSGTAIGVCTRHRRSQAWGDIAVYPMSPLLGGCTVRSACVLPGPVPQLAVLAVQQAAICLITAEMQTGGELAQWRGKQQATPEGASATAALTPLWSASLATASLAPAVLWADESSFVLWDGVAAHEVQAHTHGYSAALGMPCAGHGFQVVGYMAQSGVQLVAVPPRSFLWLVQEDTGGAVAITAAPIGDPASPSPSQPGLTLRSLSIVQLAPVSLPALSLSSQIPSACRACVTSSSTHASAWHGKGTPVHALHCLLTGCLLHGLHSVARQVLRPSQSALSSTLLLHGAVASTVAPALPVLPAQVELTLAHAMTWAARHASALPRATAWLSALPLPMALCVLVLVARKGETRRLPDWAAACGPPLALWAHALCCARVHLTALAAAVATAQGAAQTGAATPAEVARKLQVASEPAAASALTALFAAAQSLLLVQESVLSGISQSPCSLPWLPEGAGEVSEQASDLCDSLLELQEPRAAEHAPSVHIVVACAARLAPQLDQLARLTRAVLPKAALRLPEAALAESQLPHCVVHLARIRLAVLEIGEQTSAFVKRVRQMCPQPVAGATVPSTRGAAAHAASTSLPGSVRQATFSQSPTAHKP